MSYIMIGEYNMKKATIQAVISFIILLAVIEISPNILVLATSTSLIVYAIYDSKSYTEDK